MRLGQAHSGYVDTYLQLGLIGACLLVGVLYSALTRLRGALDQDFEFVSFRITMLVTIMFDNITETSYLRGDHHLWFITMLCLWFVPASATPLRAIESRQDPNLQPLDPGGQDSETVPLEPATGQGPLQQGCKL